MKVCTYCGRENDEQVTHCHECGTSFATMDTTQSSTNGKRCSVSAWPYALLVPVLVVLAHDADASLEGWSWRNNALLARPFPPVILGSLGLIAVVSFFVIRPFTSRVINRWVAFTACIAFFSLVAIVLLPKLAE